MQESVNIRTFGDFLDTLRRRRLCLVIPITGIVALSGVLALTLPPICSAKTTILIEGQQIPSEFVRSTVKTLVEETLQSITQRIMSRNRLLEIVERFSLYEDLRSRKTTEEILEGMCQDIRFGTISSKLRGGKGRSESMATLEEELFVKRKRLDQLQAELAEKKSRLSGDHPDTVRFKRSIDLPESEIAHRQSQRSLVEADLRKPSLHGIFGIEPNGGLSDCLLEQRPLCDVPVNPGINKLTLLLG